MFFRFLALVLACFHLSGCGKKSGESVYLSEYEGTWDSNCYLGVAAQFKFQGQKMTHTYSYYTSSTCASGLIYRESYDTTYKLGSDVGDKTFEFDSTLTGAQAISFDGSLTEALNILKSCGKSWSSNAWTDIKDTTCTSDLALFQIIRRDLLFAIRYEIQSTQLMKDIHMLPVNFIFAVDLAVADYAQRFAPLDSLFALWMVEVIVPHHGIMRAQDVSLVYIVSIRLTTRRMAGRHIKQIKSNIGRHDLWYLDHVKILQTFDL